MNINDVVWPEFCFVSSCGALQIKEVKETVENETGVNITEINFTDETIDPITVLPNFMAEHNPLPLDYLVRFSNGYFRCVSKEQFKRDYVALSCINITKDDEGEDFSLNIIAESSIEECEDEEA